MALESADDEGECGMKIQIEENLYLESDARQYMFKRYSGKFDKTGNETYSVVGYYPNVNLAINSLVEMKIKESNATTLKELQKDVADIKTYVKEKINF